MESQITDAQKIEEEKKFVRTLTGANIFDIEFVDVGWDSRVYLVGSGRYVVKFPRHGNKQAKAQFQREAEVLKLLESTGTNANIPRVRWTGPNNDYIGLEGVVGRTFSDVAPNVSRDIKQNIGTQIGNFLKVLHGLKPADMQVMTLEKEIKEFQEKYQLGLEIIRVSFTEDEQEQLHHLIYTEVPDVLIRLGEDLALCHGDLGYTNMVLTDSNQIGIIDFGDIGYYDRAKDFIGLQDKEIQDLALSCYGDNKTLRVKIAIRQKVLPILALPYWIGKQDLTEIQKAVEGIRTKSLSID